MKTCILLVNLGTPDAPSPGAVGRYLREFLGDGRVIDFPWLPRKLLVNGIIAPIRRFKSAKEYQKVWTDEGIARSCFTEKPCKPNSKRGCRRKTPPVTLAER